MEPKQFLTEFRHIANVEGGVARLRALILDFAIRGNLFPASSDAEPARDLLEDIQKLRRELTVTGAMRRTAPLPPIGVSDTPFALPSNWAFARLGEICDVVRGVTFPSSKKQPSGTADSVTCLRTSNIQSEIDWSDLIFIDQELVKREDQWVMPGDIMISMANSYALVGKVALVREVGARVTFGGFIAAVRPHLIDPQYLHLMLRSPYMQTQMRATASQTTNIANISLGGIRPIPTPIPPKAEQLRIVAKVEELMALCDLLKAQQQERRKLQNALRRSALQAVSNAQNPHELEESTARLEANFGYLFTASEDVDDFVTELRNLAVRGLLASSSLEMPSLDRIKAECTAEKNSCIARGIMQRQKPVGMEERETRYPDHWALAAFDDVAIVIGGVTKGRDLKKRKTVFCPYLSVANVQRGHFKLQGLKSIEIAVEELEKYLVQSGDLLVTEGGDWDKVGRTAIWQGEIENCLHQNHVFKARIPSDLLLNEWIELVFNSGVGREYFAGASKQTTNLASINMTQLRSFPVPIPPLDEQRRILATLTSLNQLSEEWRRGLQRKQELSASLANAVVSSLAGISINEEENTPVKPPKTELIAPLRLGTAPVVKAQAPLATILARAEGELPARDLWQRFGGEIDAFYAQLKTEVEHGWIAEPPVAEVLEIVGEAGA